MNDHSPFQPQDLADLDEQLLAQAVAVVSMREVFLGQNWHRVIGMRHDIDNVIEPALAMAEWEAERGYRSTYYVLHTAPYWNDERLVRGILERMADLGHEIGLHNNALAAAVVTGRDPRAILFEALERLRGWDLDIRSTVAHGDPLCYGDDKQVRFVNDEVFVECARPVFGAADRAVAGVTIRPARLSAFGLDFDASWLSRGAYLSDSGGRWSRPGFDKVAEGFPYPGQLHVLVHCDWWVDAFAPLPVAV